MPTAESAGLGGTTEVVTGASSAVGGYLLPALAAEASEVFAISRKPQPAAARLAGVHWQQLDLHSAELAALLPSPCVLLHLAPIFLLPEVLPAWLATGRIKRVVALSSTSVLTRRDASDPQDRELAQRLAAAEQSVSALCRHAAVPCTILRPTLIYGGTPQGGLGYVQAFIRRFGFFPLAGAAGGLRQPVHAEDVAQACMQVLKCPVTHDRSYEIAGGEALPFQEMVRRMFIALQRRPRLLHVPVPIVRLGLACLRLLPHYRGLGPGAADRMNHDMAFDCTAAARDFNYQPRGFSGRIDAAP